MKVNLHSPLLIKWHKNESPGALFVTLMMGKGNTPVLGSERRGFTISVKPSPETERPAANDSAMPGLEPVEPTPPDLDLPKNQGAR